MSEKRLYRVTYLYQDIDNPVDFKIGKADRIASSAEEAARIRILEQIVAGFKGNVTFIEALENTNQKIDSLTIESYVHENIQDLGYERLHRRIEFSEDDVKIGLTEWFRMKYLSVDEVRSLFRKLHTEINGKVSQKVYKPRFYQDIISAIKLNMIDKQWDNVEEIQLGTELAPRFGKTLFSLNDFMILYKERGIRVFVLPAYVLSAHSSFAKEISKFGNFYKVHQLNASSDTFKNNLIDAEKTGDPVVVYVSLSMTKEKAKIYADVMNVFSKNERYSLIDESDFGAHTEHSYEIINSVRSKITERTTGTFIERALKRIDDIGNNIIIFTQTDMQLIKKGTHPLLDLIGKKNASDNPRLNAVFMKWNRHDAMNSCAELPEIKMIKLDLTNIYGVQRALEKIDKFGWSKCLRNVKGNWGLLGSLWKAIYDRPNMDINDENFSSSRSIYLKSTCDLNVSLIYGSFPNKKEHHSFCTNLQNELGKERCIIREINGDFTTNKEVETQILREINSIKLDIPHGLGKKLILVSKDMAARSFSISEIDTVFLMYDSGMISQTAQKISRAFTPGKDIFGNEKIRCNVVSLSLDTQRTYCPIDLFIVREAGRISETYNKNGNIIPNIKHVAECYNILRNDINRGIIPFEIDEYSKFLLEGSSEDLLRIAASAVNVDVDQVLLNMGQDMLDALFISDATRKGNKVNGHEGISTKDVKSYLQNDPVSTSPKNKSPKIVSLKEKLINLIRDINFCAPELCMFDNYEHNTIENVIYSLVNKKDLHSFIENDLGFSILLAKHILPNLNKKLLNTALAVFIEDERKIAVI